MFDNFYTSPYLYTADKEMFDEERFGFITPELVKLDIIFIKNATMLPIGVYLKSVFYLLLNKAAR